MTLQAALDHVFQAIRSENRHDETGIDPDKRLAEAKATNDTFVSAAARVVKGETGGQAGDFLASAQEARATADSSAANGDLDAAVDELERSTRLAQQAIMSVRNGMVIERRQ